MRKRILGIVVLMSMIFTLGAFAQGKFPTKPIKIIVPWDAGGGTDAVARALARSGEKYLGVPVVVENKPGGSGAVGLAEVVQAAPDGYTLAILPVELGFMDKTGVYPFGFKDFTPIMNLNTDPAALTVKTGKFKSVAEFVAYGKANPGKLKVGNSGTGLLWHLAAAVFAKEAGISLTYVPFSGAAPAIAALLGNQIDAVSVSGAEVQSQVKAGELTMLACMGDKRLANFPEVPTLMELGYNVNINTFRGIGGPKGLPADRVKILHDAFKKMMEEQEFVQTLTKMGLGIDYRSTADYKKLADDTAATLAPILTELGLLRNK
ncbi:MAG: tripartite tricarboxylate transporter substrate binding protein [Rectinema sp.]